MLPFTLISFYTPTWKYPESAARLRVECEALGIDHYIKEIPDQGSYLANTAYKPRFIRDALLELKKPVLWIDVDGSILKMPNTPALDFSLDFMAREKNPLRRNKIKRHWHVGTMFFNYTPAAFNLLDLWIEHLQPNNSDEAVLDILWKKGIWQNECKGRYGNLPKEYFEVVGKGWQNKPSQKCVIFHRISNSDSKLEQVRKGLCKW